MKHILILIIITLASIPSFGQISVSVDSIFTYIRQNSVHTKDVDWSQLQKGFTKKLEQAKTDVDTIKSFVYVFEQLNDFHSQIIYNGSVYSHYPSFDDTTLRYLVPLVNLSYQQTGKFKATLLGDGYLYLQVPGIQAMGDQVSVFAQMLSDTLCQYLTPRTKGIVIDLRLNSGGQFSSMAAGLAPLLGDTYIGGGVNSDSIQSMTFTLKKGNIYHNGIQRTSIIHKIDRGYNKLPVAILIGPNTRSSGSILAISFKGRAKTVFIGEHTASGYTTSNYYFPLSTSLFLNLSTTHSIDRNNTVYKVTVEPDVIIRGEDDFNAVTQDNKVKAALQWLKKNSH